MNKKYVSNRPISGSMDVVGIGYIVVPPQIDINEYIEHSFRTGTISLALENGGIIDNVAITKEAIQNLNFPESSTTLGSQILYVSLPRKNQPIAIGSISKNNEFVNFSKNKSSLRRATKNYVSEVLVDADKGTIIITSNSSVIGGGDIYILSTNKDKSSKLTLVVSKDINISSQNFTLTNSKKLSFIVKDKDIDNNITQITYEKGVGLTYNDEFGNKIICSSDNIQLSPNSKLNIGDGNEPMMLSNTFKDILDDFTDIVSNLSEACAEITVTVASFGSPTPIPNNAASFINIKSKLSDIKLKYKNFQSSKGFTD
jgi:hypothetical protein